MDTLTTPASRTPERTTSREARWRRRMVRLVRENPLITIRELARRVRQTQEAALSECEAQYLNVNVGGTCYAGYWTHDHIGDYTVEDLNAEHPR